MRKNWGWDALTDLLSNLMGVLILLMLVSFIIGLIDAQETSVTGEVRTSLPLTFIFSTVEGVFPIRVADALKRFIDTPVSQTPEGELVGYNSVDSAHGQINIEFRAHPDEINSCILLRPEGKGCTTSELLNGLCPGFTLSDQVPGYSLLFFQVYPGGYDSFEHVCSEAALLGFETSWKPRLPDEPGFLCRGGHQWIDRQVEGGRSVTSQSCHWLVGASQ